MAVSAQPPLSFPLACTLGEDCWIVNYVDVEPRPDTARDFHCGARTYDGHRGTDFAIRDWAAMQRGVPVLAAAGGTVLRVRDGVADAVLSAAERRRLLQANRGCGNGVVIEHEDGWQTMYCHLKKDSVIATPGVTIRAGDKLGEVGHSGNVEFPHLHLGVVHRKDTIDPFTGHSSRDGCNRMPAPLWQPALQPGYEPLSLYAAGFAAAAPDFERIKKNAATPAALSPDVPALTFWAGIYGVVAGDRMDLRILDPRGGVFATRDIVQPKTRARQFYYVGRRVRGGLAPGTYTGILQLIRVTSGGEQVRREISRRLQVTE